jgi:hypothetical protein
MEDTTRKKVEVCNRSSGGTTLMDGDYGNAKANGNVSFKVFFYS